MSGSVPSRTSRSRKTPLVKRIYPSILALFTWPEGARNELALKLFFGQSASPASSRALLEAHRAHHRRQQDRYGEDWPEVEARATAGEADRDAQGL